MKSRVSHFVAEGKAHFLDKVFLTNQSSSEFMGWFLIPKAIPLEKAVLVTKSSSHTHGGDLRHTLCHPFSQCSSLFTANPTFPSTISFSILCPTFYFLSPSSVFLSTFWRPTRFPYSSHVSFGRCLALARPEDPQEGPVSTVFTDTSQVSEMPKSILIPNYNEHTWSKSIITQ